MMHLLMLAVLSNPANVPRTVDIVEVNHTHSQTDDSIVIEQIIFRRWSPDYRRYDVVGWLFYSQKTPVHHIGNRYLFDAGPTVIAAPMFRETWTYFDPEIKEQTLFPTQYRFW